MHLTNFSLIYFFKSFLFLAHRAETEAGVGKLYKSFIDWNGIFLAELFDGFYAKWDTLVQKSPKESIGVH